VTGGEEDEAGEEEGDEKSKSKMRAELVQLAGSLCQRGSEAGEKKH
jgi:hypothetical protein